MAHCSREMRKARRIEPAGFGSLSDRRDSRNHEASSRQRRIGASVRNTLRGIRREAGMNLDAVQQIIGEIELLIILRIGWHIG